MERSSLLCDVAGGICVGSYSEPESLTAQMDFESKYCIRAAEFDKMSGRNLWEQEQHCCVASRGLFFLGVFLHAGAQTVRTGLRGVSEGAGGACPRSNSTIHHHTHSELM